MEIKLSIIIPVYGVEDYIEECFHSLLPQIDENIEVIIVNDGCVDSSIEKLNILLDEYYSDKKKFIKILKQNNSGQSVARNNGISISKGEYIAFIDPDDYVSKNYISTILAELNNEKAIDVLHFNAKQVDDVSGLFLEELILVKTNKNITKQDTYLENLFLKSIWYPWMRVIRSEIIKDYFFEPNIYLEDMTLFPEIYYDSRVKKIKEIVDELVIYRHRINSSIRDPFSKKIIDGIDFGIKKFSNEKYALYSILYNQLVLQRVSLLFFQNKSFLCINKICKNYIKNVHLNYNFSGKIWLFKKLNFVYLVLFKIKHFFK